MTTEVYADQRGHDVAWMTAEERAALDVPRFAVTASEHGWQWTYSNITRAEAEDIAAQLTAHSGETWAVAPVERYEIWPSPEGVSHLVPVLEDRGAVCEPLTGPCITCGRHHHVLHFRNVRVYADQHRETKCATEVTTWPYECIAKDKNPGHTVYRCTVHGVWWHQPA